MKFNRLFAIGGLVLAVALLCVGAAPDALAATTAIVHAPTNFGASLPVILASAAAAAVAPEEVKKAVDGFMTAFEEFKAANDSRLKEIEKKGAADPLVEQKLTKINDSLNQFEAFNQKLTLAAQQSKAATDKADELKEQMDRIETALKQKPAGFFVDASAGLIRPGNFEDDLGRVEGAGIHELDGGQHIELARRDAARSEYLRLRGWREC